MSVAIEVAIGIAVVFLLFSLVVSGIRELVAKLLATRSKELWRQIVHLVEQPPSAINAPVRKNPFKGLRTAARIEGNPARTGGGSGRPPSRGGAPPTAAALIAPESTEKGLADVIYRHPAIQSLDRSWDGFQSRLTNIPPQDFAGTVVDLLLTAGTTPYDTLKNSVAEVLGEQERQRVAGLVDTAKTTIDAAKGPRAGVVRDALKAIADDIGEDQGLSDDQKRRVAEALETAQFTLTRRGYDQGVAAIAIGIGKLIPGDTPLEGALQRMVAETGEKTGEHLAEFRTALEGWFDTQMEALSASYRKRTRWVLVIIGIIIAFLFNIDAVTIPRELWTNEQVRAAAVALGDGMLDTGADSELRTCVEESEDSADDSRDCMRQAVDSVVSTELPVGFPPRWDCRNAEGEDPGCNVGEGSLKVMGLILGGAALAMGAPFWFDVLRRAAGFRKPRARSTE